MNFGGDPLRMTPMTNDTCQIHTWLLTMKDSHLNHTFWKSYFGLSRFSETSVWYLFRHHLCTYFLPPQSLDYFRRKTVFFENCPWLWDKVFQNGPSKFFKARLPQILIVPFWNTLSHMNLPSSLFLSFSLVLFSLTMLPQVISYL